MLTLSYFIAHQTTLMCGAPFMRRGTLGVLQGDGNDLFAFVESNKAWSKPKRGCLRRGCLRRGCLRRYRGCLRLQLSSSLQVLNLFTVGSLAA